MSRAKRQRENRELIDRLERDARRIAWRFGLRYRVIEAERANVKRRYGICYSDGTIRIRLRNVKNGEPLKYSSLVNTLCHELAHLRHFDHSPRFHVFYRELLAWAKRNDIYRPAPARTPAVRRPPPPRREPWHTPAPAAPALAEPSRVEPLQLSLFGGAR